MVNVACAGGCTATLTFVPRAELIEAAMAVLSTLCTAARMAVSERAGGDGALPGAAGLVGGGAARMVMVSCSEPAAAERSMSDTGTP